MHDALITTDHLWNISSWNAAAERVYGWSAEEAHGRSIIDLLQTQWDNDDARLAAEENVTHGEHWEGEVSQVRKDGRKVRILSAVSRLRDNAGEMAGVVAVNRDVTDQRAVEAALEDARARLMVAQRLEALGRMAGGVAHDFNNLLSVVLGSADLLRVSITHTDSSQKHLRMITHAAERGAALTRQLLAFGRQPIGQQETVEFGQVLRNLEELILRLAGERILVQMQISPAPLFVRSDRSQIEQVVLNLVINARDAMPERGHLCISLDQEGRDVILKVSDTGVGMDEATRARIFEPFFTTRSQQGTGLGLSVVFGVIKQAKGHIDVLTAMGKGTTFVIRLPLLEGMHIPVPSPHPPLCDPGNCRVLLAEDQESVREVVAALLEDLGHSVSVARDGIDAMRLVDNGIRFDLLITDVVMPRMGGPELANRLRKRRPNLPILYLSGFPAEDNSGMATWPVGILQSKPVTRQELALSIARAMMQMQEITKAY
jgi:PAS domain S-box-containing protein